MRAIVSYLQSGEVIHKLNDKKHRKEIEGPAVTYKDGTKLWYKEGMLHRKYGPAIESNNGFFWYKDGLLHRDNGPAIEVFNKVKIWYRNGKKHREDGPAIESEGKKYWYLNGKRFSEKEFEKAVKLDINDISFISPLPPVAL